MKRHLAILTALCVCACGGKAGNGDADTDVPDDVVIETDGGDGGVCTPGEGECQEDGVTLRRCRSDGTGWEMVNCPVGCVDDHCQEWDISNIDDMDLLWAGEATEEDWLAGVPDGTHWVGFNTENGRVTIFLEAPPAFGYPSWETGMELRDPGTGLDEATGIHFTHVRDSDGARVGVFSFQRLHVPSNYTFGSVATYPLVLISEEDALIEGKVWSGCLWDTGPAYSGASNTGEGDGAGGDGSASGADFGGGGGGGYGGPGGDGSGNGGTGGAGGGTHGTAEIIPLVGGSGGGSSDGMDAWDGSRGGRSGGSLEIVSASTLTLAAGGWIDASGCGGFPSFHESSFKGGGGGGSGGAILLEAPTLVIEGAISVNGGGGAGGGLGYEIWTSYGDVGMAGSDTAAGGGVADSADGCNGADGNGGGGDAGSDGADCTSLYGGGGGGGAGRIRLNGQDRTITGTLSPGLGSDAVTEGDLVLP